jgi:hypothetical protein
LTFTLENTAQTYTGGKKPIVTETHYAGYFTPSPPDRIKGTYLECNETDAKAAIKGEVKYIPCPEVYYKGVSFEVLVGLNQDDQDQLKLQAQGREVLFTRKAQ